MCLYVYVKHTQTFTEINTCQFVDMTTGGYKSQVHLFRLVINPVPGDFYSSTLLIKLADACPGLQLTISTSVWITVIWPSVHCDLCALCIVSSYANAHCKAANINIVIQHTDIMLAVWCCYVCVLLFCLQTLCVNLPHLTIIKVWLQNH